MPTKGHTGWATYTLFSPDGKYIVSGSDNGVIRLWKFETDNLDVALRLFKRHTASIASISFSPDGKHIASGSWDHSIRLWNVETGEAASKPFVGHSLGTLRLIFTRRKVHWFWLI